MKSRFFREKYYTGITNNIERRMEENNKGKNISTSKYKPWDLKTFITFSDDDKAAKFEQFLKSGSGVVFSQRHFR